MPFIEVMTNIPASKEEQIKARLAEILASSFPGKTENWLMIDFKWGGSMYFAGSSAPCAMVRIALFGKGWSESYDKMTAGVCGLIEAELGIPSDRIYVKYEEVDRWGWNGGNF